MIGKNEQTDDNSNVDRIKLIADRKKSLEANTTQIREEIRICFARLTEVLETRKRQLLRQAEAVHTQQLSLIESSLEFLPPSIINFNEKNDLEERIKRFGKIEQPGTNCITVKDVEPYKVQDYQEANKDHVSFNKSIICDNDAAEEKETEDFLENQEIAESNCSSLPESSPCSNSVNDVNVTQNIKRRSDSSERTERLEILSPSPSLAIKQINSTDLSTEETGLETKCSNNNVDTKDERVDSFEVVMTSESNSETECSYKTNAYVKTEVNDLNDLHDQRISERLTKEHTKNEEVLRDSCEHPKQIQQWLQQILVETEIEPMIHEVGQFSEISEAQTYNNVQLKT